MVPTGANGGVLGLEKNDGRPRKRKPKQKMSASQKGEAYLPVLWC